MEAHRWKGLSPSDWAAWVQAVGSIAAIVGAYFLGERQANATRIAAIELQDREKEQKRAAIFAICTAAKIRTDLVRNIFGAEYDEQLRMRHYDHSTIRSSIEAMTSVPVLEIGDARALSAFMDMRDQLGFMVKAIDQFELRQSGGTREQYQQEAKSKQIRQGNIIRHVEKIDSCYCVLTEIIGVTI
jgi:hypothetical protein